MTDEEIVNALVDRSVLGLTLWGEARGEPTDGRLAVGGVIKNRMTLPAHYRATAATWKAVCLAPSQFSCWMKSGGEENYAQVMHWAEVLVSGFPVTDPDLRECLYLADGLIAGVFQDRSKKATYYLETLFFKKEPPRWTAQLTVTAVIGSHTFLMETQV